MSEQAFEAGKQAWREGADMPPMPPDNAEDEIAMFWLGYVWERSRDFFKRREMALYPDTVEPRP